MKRKLSVLIVDDEQDARDILRYFLEKIPLIGRIEDASNSDEALFKYLEMKPDLVLLDIVMPGGRDGGELIELFKGKDPDCNIIIVSSHKDSAIMAIQNGIYDFILKPVQLKVLREKIANYHGQKPSIENKIQKALNDVDNGPKLRISSTNDHILVDPSEILYIEADGVYSVITMQNGTKELANTYLGKLEDILSPQRFFRISRSTLINLDKLSQINKIESTCTLHGFDFDICLSGSKKQIKILCELDLN